MNILFIPSNIDPVIRKLDLARLDFAYYGEVEEEKVVKV